MTPKPSELRERPGDQPLPMPNAFPFIHDLMVRDINEIFSLTETKHTLTADVLARKALWERRYGTPLQPFNGRNVVLDAYEELLDAAAYLRQALYEAECGKNVKAAAVGMLGETYAEVLTHAMLIRKLL